MRRYHVATGPVRICEVGPPPPGRSWARDGEPDAIHISVCIRGWKGATFEGTRRAGTDSIVWAVFIEVDETKTEIAPFGMTDSMKLFTTTSAGREQVILEL